MEREKRVRASIAPEAPARLEAWAMSLPRYRRAS